MNKTQLLFEEYKITNDKIESFLQSQHKYINSLLLLLAGCLVFVYDSKVPRTEYLLALPMVFLTVFSVFIYHYKRTMALQGYKKYLEYELNKSLTENVLNFGNIGFEIMVKKDILSKVNVVTYLIIYSALVYFAYAKNTDNMFWTWINIGLGVTMVIIAFIERNTTNKIIQKSFDQSKSFKYDDRDPEKPKE